MNSSQPGNYFFLKTIIFPLFLFNPAIVFLLTKSFLTSLAIFFITVAIIYQSRYFHKTFKVFTINFLVLLSIFMHCELVFRFGFPDYIIENLYEIQDGYYFNKPLLISEIRDKEYNVLYKTNIQGFRMPASISQEKEITNCDWLFIGDSFTQGAQVEFKDLYTSQVYRNHPDKVIVNAGISGFGILDELEYYKKEGYQLNPKKVVLQLCSFNDFMNVKGSRNKFSDYLMQYSDFARFLLYGLKFKSPGELPLGRWTEPFYPTEKDNLDFNIFFKEKSDRQLNDIQYFKEALRKFKLEVEKNNSELCVFLIPTKEQVYSHYLEEVKSTFGISDNQIDLLIPNKLMEELCNSLNIEFVDLLSGFKDGQEPVFYDYDEHLNRYGHFLTSQLIESVFLDSVSQNSPVLLSDNFLGERYPSCADGKLLFQASRDGNMEIITRDLNSETENRFTYNDIDESHPTFNQGRNLLAFTEGDATKMNTKVAFLDLNTGIRSYLDKDSQTFSAIPYFSKDGNFITYAEWTGDITKQEFSLPSIVVSSIDNLDKKDYLTNINSTESWRPVFTPDGNAVVYISKEQGNFDIFIANLCGGETIQLTNTPYDEWDPVVSPDGNKILFAAFIDDNWDLMELDLVSKSQRRLTKSIGDEWDPQYCQINDGIIIYAGEFGFFSCIYQKAF